MDVSQLSFIGLGNYVWGFVGETPTPELRSLELGLHEVLTKSRGLPDSKYLLDGMSCDTRLLGNNMIPP